MERSCYLFAFNLYEFVTLSSTRNQSKYAANSRQERCVSVFRSYKKILAFGPISLGIFINIKWMLIGTIIVGIISFFLNSWYTGKDLNYSSLMQLKDVSTSFLIASFISSIIYMLKYIPFPIYIILIIQVLFWGSSLITICEFLNIHEYCEIKGIIVKTTRNF